VLAAGGVERPDLGDAGTPPTAVLSRDVVPQDVASPEEAPCGPEVDLLRRAQAVDRLSAAMTEQVRGEARTWLDRGRLVGLIGGDHSTPLGLIQEVAARHPGLGILQLDAHADLRPAFEGFRFSHASIMDNVLATAAGVARLVQVGVRDFGAVEAAAIRASGGRVRTWFDPDLRERLQDGEPWSAIAREIVSALPETVYLSFDVDGLDPALCPHTGTPVPGGLSFAEAVSLLRHVAKSGRRIVGFDLVETAPGPAGDEWDANVAARLLYKMIGYSLLSVSRGADLS
jgi:agmatinase